MLKISLIDGKVGRRRLILEGKLRSALDSRELRHACEEAKRGPS